MSPPACMSNRCLSLGERSSVTHEPSSLTVVVEYFFIRSPWVAGNVVALVPSQAGCLDLVSRDAWHLRSPPSREAGSGATGHMAASEPSHAGRRGLGPRNAWRP
jgi:hypothetical protein